MRFSAQQQKTHNINCHQLKSDLIQFLDLKIQPLLNARKSGKDWRLIVPSDLIQELEKTRSNLVFCRSLYATGNSGKLNDLTNLGFIDKIFEDYSIIQVYLTIGAPYPCNTSCLDNHFSDLKISLTKVKSILANEK